jgi:predicted transposase YbfD/YdcC
MQQPLSQAEHLRPILINRSLIPSLFCALGIVTCLIFLRTSLIGNQALTHAGWNQAALLYMADTEPCCRTVIDWYQNEQELAVASALLLSCELGRKNLANYVGKKQSISTCHAWVLHVHRNQELFLSVRWNIFQISAFVNVCKWFCSSAWIL